MINVHLSVLRMNNLIKIREIKCKNYKTKFVMSV